MKKIIIASIFTLLTAPPVLAQPDMKAQIKVSSGDAYDYVIVGEMAKATDGFDNSFDAFDPAGNMNDAYVKTTVDHPEWGQVKSEFRSDMRELKEHQEWDVTVFTNLPAGTPLTLMLDTEKSILPPEYTVTAQDRETGAVIALTAATLTFTGSSSPLTRHFLIVADASDAGGPVTGGTTTTPPPAPSLFSISGKVTGFSGRLLPNIRINLSGAGISKITMSNASGEYQFTEIPSGEYKITGLDKEARGRSREKKFRINSVTVIVQDTDLKVDLTAVQR